MKGSKLIDYNGLWAKFISIGSEESFSLIYIENYDFLYYYGLKFTSDIQIIEDSIQNIFSYFWKTKKKLKPVTNIRSFLLVSFRRQLLLDLKKQKRILAPDHLKENLSEQFNSIEQDILEKDEMNELQAAIKKSLKNLTVKQQEIIYLRYDCELNYDEIALMLEISVDSCYKSVYRSIKSIKASIELILGRGNHFLFLIIFRNLKRFQ